MKPKLTLRDLFAIVTIAAMALGWWLDRSRLAKDAAAAWQFAELKTTELNNQLSHNTRLTEEVFKRADENWRLRRKLTDRDDSSRDQPSHSN